MRLALQAAQQALQEAEVPVGAVVTQGRQVLSVAHNLREQQSDPTAHAEMVALREAAQQLQRWRLQDCWLWVTLEPCPMCATAVRLAQMEGLFYGAQDPRIGGCGGWIDVIHETALGPPPQVRGGLLAEAAAALLQQFFAQLRTQQTRRDG